jgi:hypothetical protein
MVTKESIPLQLCDRELVHCPFCGDPLYPASASFIPGSLPQDRFCMACRIHWMLSRLKASNRVQIIGNQRLDKKPEAEASGATE